jgi:hypothetical protein
MLQLKRDFLYNHGFFIVGDSAYCMESFLLVPYDRPNMRRSEGQQQDAYNFYHSNCRIRIECTFGEIMMRWGIFWRKLQFDVAVVGEIIAAAGLLHNFIVDERDAESSCYIANFSHTNLRDDNEHDEEVPVAMVTDNNERKPPGRPTLEDALSKQKGRDLRRAICWNLASRQLARPTQTGFRYNSYGMIYMEG